MSFPFSLDARTSVCFILQASFCNAGLRLKCRLILGISFQIQVLCLAAQEHPAQLPTPPLPVVFLFVVLLFVGI